ncbi:hypothetical protein C8R44DRAFT_725853 [Mycena epipterygia]|nr:hypothetical protein C8R44DRAFT_725853 [Mycena epipterygia]
MDAPTDPLPPAWVYPCPIQLGLYVGNHAVKQGHTGDCKAGQQMNKQIANYISGQQTNERTVQVIVKPGSKWGGNCETGQRMAYQCRQSKQGSEWHISAGDCKARQQTNEQMLLAIVKQGSEWCISESNREVGQQMAYQCSKAVNGVSAQVAGQQMNEQMLQAIVKQGSAAGDHEAGQQMNEQMLQAIVKRGSAAGNREAGQQIMAANGVSVQASVKQGQQTNEQAVCLCTRLASSGVQQGKGLPYEQQRWAKIEKTSWPGPNMRETVEASHICLAMWRTMASSEGPERVTVRAL